MRRAVSAFLLATALVAPAQAAPIAVPMDEVKLITFAKPVATIYVGNPVIADVTMVDSRRAFVLGKMFGATNIIALDANGEQISNSQITVFGREGAIVTLSKGSSQQTLTCNGRCEATPMPGDGKDAFDASVTQIEKHQGLGKTAANGE